MFKYTTAIKKIRGISARKKVIQGGSSAGKTFAILPVLIDKAIKTAGLEISVVSESVPHLRRGAIKDFAKIMQLTGRWFPDHWNKSLLRYTFANGSTIEFFSADMEGRLRGARRTTLFVNEANNIDFEAYHQLAIRTSGEIYLDFNPTAEFWAHTEVLTSSDSELLILTYKDNEALPDNVLQDFQDAIEKAKTSEYWANWVKVYVNGQVGALQGVVFSNWETIPELDERARFVGIGLDFGYSNDPTGAVALWVLDGAPIFDEIVYAKGLQNDQIHRYIKQYKEKHRIFNENVVADSAEPKSIDYLSGLGMDIEGAEKGKDSINFGIQLMQEQDFQVTEQSTNIIDELRRYTWATDKTGKSLQKPIDKYNHLIDAMRYIYVQKFNNKYAGEYHVSNI